MFTIVDYTWQQEVPTSSDLLKKFNMQVNTCTLQENTRPSMGQAVGLLVGNADGSLIEQLY